MLLTRVRYGQLRPERIMWASHLGHKTCRLIEPDPSVMVDCKYCARRRKVIPEIPRPVQRPPRVCVKCNNTESIQLESGLIKFVCEVVEVPLRVLIAWAHDCAERQIEKLSPINPRAFHGRYRLPNTTERDTTLLETLRCTKRWLDGQAIDPMLFQVTANHPNRTLNRDAPFYLAQAVVRCGMEDDSILRSGLGGVVSNAYAAAGMSRDERSWQENRLTELLLEDV